jgi:hypothetical protein
MSKFSQGQISTNNSFFFRVVMASIADFTRGVFSLATLFDLEGHKIFVKLLRVGNLAL